MKVETEESSVYAIWYKGPNGMDTLVEVAAEKVFDDDGWFYFQRKGMVAFAVRKDLTITVEVMA